MCDKKCSRCGECKPLSEFNKRKESKKDGHRAECKKCSKKERLDRRHHQNIPCPQCGVLCWSKKGVCTNCRSKNATEKWKKERLGNKVYDNHKYAKYQYVRHFARSIGLKTWDKCCKCGYDKHIEICHIRPISDFPPETFLSEVNDISNLIALCPNCHWEHDHAK